MKVMAFWVYPRTPLFDLVLMKNMKNALAEQNETRVNIYL